MPPKKLRIYKFSKVAKYEVNKQKSVAFLYINNDQSNKESMKTIPFILPSNGEFVQYRREKSNI